LSYAGESGQKLPKITAWM